VSPGRWAKRESQLLIVPLVSTGRVSLGTQRTLWISCGRVGAFITGNQLPVSIPHDSETKRPMRVVDKLGAILDEDRRGTVFAAISGQK